MGLVLPDVFEVPIFPLPDVVLFPGTVLPLHIFEPRYRKMLADAMAGERMIGMAQLQHGWESHVGLKPPVLPLLGVGRVADTENLADGRCNIALIGLARCRILNEVEKDEPYRIASVETLRDKALHGAEQHKLSKDIRAAIQATAELLLRRSVRPEARELLGRSLAEREDPGAAADFLASVFIRDPRIRQTLLENLDALQRAAQVQKLLERVATSLEPEPPPLTGKLDDFSKN